MKNRDNADKKDTLCLETKDFVANTIKRYSVFHKLPILTAQLLPSPVFE